MTWNFKTLASTAFLISLVGCVWLVYSSGRRSGMTEVQSSWNLERLEIERATSEELAKARLRESALLDQAAKLRKEKDDEIRRISAEYERVIDGLRNRPARPAPSPAGVPQAPAAGAEPAPSCTGRELYREDGEFLAREAARADQLRLALGQCQAQYGALTGD